MKNIFYSLFIICFCFSSFSFAAGFESYKFRVFSPEGGFYYDGIKKIKQDRDGFIWVLMDNDLFRFDGYEYRKYYTRFNEIDRTDKLEFYDLIAGNNGVMYVSCSGGLYIYNRLQDRFDRVSSVVSDWLGLDDVTNRLWLKKGVELSFWDVDKREIVPVFYESKPIKYIGSSSSGKNGFFVASYYGKVYLFDDEEGCFRVFLTLDRSWIIQDIKQVEDRLWVLVLGKGLIEISIPNREIINQFDIFHSSDGRKVMTRMLHVDKFNRIWVATQQGLYVLNSTSGKYIHYMHQQSDEFSLPNNSIWYIVEDHQRNIWIGTYSGGLCYVNLDEKVRFRTYRAKDGLLNNNLVSGFAEDTEFVWIGTEGGGVNRLEKSTDRFSYLKNVGEKSRSLSFDNVKSIVLDDSGRLWIGMFRGGLDCYDTNRGSFMRYKQQGEGRNRLVSNNLRKIVLQPDSGLWIVYQKKKYVVSFLSFRTREIDHYYFNQGDDYKDYIFDLNYGGDGRLWMVTHRKLYCLDTNTKRIDEVCMDDSLYLNAQTVCAGKDGNVWIGTIGRGLIRYNSKTSETVVLDAILKFGVSSIYSLCLDDENNVWVGTDNGLFRYSPVSDQLFRFDKKDGVQGQVYYPLAAFKNGKGKLYFGGTNGFTIIDPRELKANLFEPNVILSDFFVDNVSFSSRDEFIKSGSLDLFSDEIRLPYNQQNFGFQFSSDNYLIPEKNRFRYRLKGYDDRWLETNAKNRTVFYSKVPAGTYVFEVAAANNDGVWGSVSKRIVIKRLPAPWFSWWAYCLYFIAFCVVLFFIVRYYRKQKRLELELYFEKMEQEKRKELHESQLRFFTNISHDFRTPLALIVAALNKLRQEGLQEYYYRILNSNARRLLNLVNELMDFRTIEKGCFSLGVELVDVNAYVKELASDFQDYATQREMRYDMECDVGMAEVYVDRYIIEKIVMNLLHNAFKYTQNGGEVLVKTYADSHSFRSMYDVKHTISNDIDVAEKYFSIVVQDTGVGISKESIANVFDRFYKVKTVNFDSHLGTGVGLALVKGLVLLHKGIITIYSERDRGTDIEVCLPIDSSVYGVDDFKQIGSEKQVKDTLIIKSVKDVSAITTSKKEEIVEDMKLPSTKKQVLIVEDNNSLRDFMRDALVELYDVYEASDGEMALRLLKKNRIGLIISDIMMPVKDGITLCREVKANAEMSHIPFVLLTAKTGVNSQMEGVDAGADLYFEKPIDFELLKLSVENLFKRQEQIKKHYAKHFFADDPQDAINEQDSRFMQKFIDVLDRNIDQPDMDVHYIASELSMSRSKLYSKIKQLTNKSIVEFILSYRLRMASRLIIEKDMSMREVMEQIGIESQSYFTRAFKKEFGETPTMFANKHKKLK